MVKVTYNVRIVTVEHNKMEKKIQLSSNISNIMLCIKD